MPGPKLDPRVARTREALHRALGHLLRGRSFGELTLQEIAAQAGLSRPTIYKHYADKVALLEDWVAGEFQRRLADALSRAGESGVDKLAAVVSSSCGLTEWVRTIGRSDDRVLLAIAEARMRPLLQGAIRFGIEEGLLAPAAAPGMAAAVAGAMIHAAALEWAGARRKPAREAFVREIVHLLAGVIEPAPPRGAKPSRSRG